MRPDDPRRRRRSRRAELVAGTLALLLATGAVAGADGSSSAAPAPDGTRRMAERLLAFADAADPETNLFLSAERAARFEALGPPDHPLERLRWETTVALELLNSGRASEAAARLETVWEKIRGSRRLRKSPFGREAHALLALAWLRVGEQENCILHHGTDSCLLPIRGSGVHTEERGSRAAVRELLAILERHPDDLGSRWLLNLAYMTLGEYPTAVPRRWLIPPAAFESDHDIGRFHDVAAAAGLDVTGLAGAAIMEDFDGDRHLDVLVTSWGLRDQMRLLRNRRDGTFVDRTAEANLTGLVSGLNAVHADYDNDGDMDVFVPRGAWLREDGRMPQSLLRNRGDGAFDDVTDEAGLLAFHPSQAAAWGDYDNDGWVDLFVAPESTAEGSPHPSKLYRNRGDGTFEEVAARVGLEVLGYLKGAVWGDYDNDGRLDLYVTVLQGAPANALFHNDGPVPAGGWRFTDVTEKAGVLGPATSFPTWFFDYDNDGWLDLFASGYGGTLEDVAADYLGIGRHEDGDTPRLYRNRRDGTFRDVTREARLDTVLMTMGCNFGDLDNDGWPDFYVATGNPDYRTLVPNRMFRNAGGRAFEDVTTSGGFGHLQKGHAVAFGDLDNDGDQDVFLKVGGAFPGDAFQSALFENPGHGNRWITLELVGTKSNRAAIGARIRVTIEEDGGSTRDVHATVTSGSSFGGNSLRQEIGLGRATRIRAIEVVWPASGIRQAFEDVALDRYYEVREDEGALRPVTLEPTTLGGASRPASPAATAAH
jgi:hypothetical protein